ncbi:acyl-CoA thioesterase domain-containing protein [Streptomyces sp. NPDC046831]|uniref:acyl-CoA thioesterase domain-containing protein n=1 Tax=Streptomyces sp. NPDC046831 TaxID=3154805 RepID=UPI0033D21BDB
MPVAGSRGSPAARGEPGPSRGAPTRRDRTRTPVDERPLQFTSRILRAGRRTSMSSVTAVQADAPVLTGTAVFGRGGHGPSHTDLPMPAAPAPGAWPPLAGAPADTPLRGCLSARRPLPHGLKSVGALPSSATAHRCNGN